MEQGSSRGASRCQCCVGLRERRPSFPLAQAAVFPRRSCWQAGPLHVHAGLSGPGSTATEQAARWVGLSAQRPRFLKRWAWVAPQPLHQAQSAWGLQTTRALPSPAPAVPPRAGCQPGGLCTLAGLGLGCTWRAAPGPPCQPATDLPCSCSIACVRRCRPAGMMPGSLPWSLSRPPPPSPWQQPRWLPSEWHANHPGLVILANTVAERCTRRACQVDATFLCRPQRGRSPPQRRQGGLEQRGLRHLEVVGPGLLALRAAPGPVCHGASGRQCQPGCARGGTARAEAAHGA